MSLRAISAFTFTFFLQYATGATNLIVCNYTLHCAIRWRADFQTSADQNMCSPGTSLWQTYRRGLLYVFPSHIATVRDGLQTCRISTRYQGFFNQASFWRGLPPNFRNPQEFLASIENLVIAVFKALQSFKCRPNIV